MRTRGQITLPREIQKQLRVREGEQLTWIQVGNGLAILSKGSMTREQIAERLLADLVVGIGQAAEKRGIQEEDDLDRLVNTLRKRSFEARYAQHPASSFR
jgi:bifunctional DNA-binding transcriptional regulator/antitoxin component of YhaV-PrlF toxin-antitoxin module